VGQSLVDILTAIALLENSLDEQTEGSLPENLPTIHALIDNLIAEFQTLDQQLKVNYCHQQIHQNYPDLAEKAHLKVGVVQLNPTPVIILLYP
jgi:phage I-like protein